jgi:hypothetical protein
MTCHRNVLSRHGFTLWNHRARRNLSGQCLVEWLEFSSPPTMSILIIGEGPFALRAEAEGLSWQKCAANPPETARRPRQFTEAGARCIIRMCAMWPRRPGPRSVFRAERDTMAPSFGPPRGRRSSIPGCERRSQSSHSLNGVQEVTSSILVRSTTLLLTCFPQPAHIPLAYRCR